MRRGNGHDTAGTEGEVSWSSTYLRKKGEGQRPAVSTAYGLAQIEGAEEDCGGEGSEAGKWCSG